MPKNEFQKVKLVVSEKDEKTFEKVKKTFKHLHFLAQSSET